MLGLRFFINDRPPGNHFSDTVIYFGSTTDNSTVTGFFKIGEQKYYSYFNGINLFNVIYTVDSLYKTGNYSWNALMVIMVFALEILYCLLL